MTNIFLELFRSLRRKIHVVLGKDVKLDPVVTGPLIHVGSEYGGYWINTNDLHPNSIIYSLGVGEDATFDIELINKIGCHVHAFDPTPKSVQWVQNQNLPERFIFTAWGVSDSDCTTEFYPPNNPNHVSHSLVQHKGVRSEGVKVEFRSLETIMNHFGHHIIDLLKMDVEGEEYAIIKDIVRSNIQVKQLCVEFHHRFSGIGIEFTKRAVDDLASIGLQLFHQDADCCSFIRV